MALQVLWFTAIGGACILPSVFLFRKVLGLSLHFQTYLKTTCFYENHKNVYIPTIRGEYCPPATYKLLEEGWKFVNPESENTPRTPPWVSIERSSKGTERVSSQAGALSSHILTTAQFLFASLFASQHWSRWGRGTCSLGCYLMCSLCTLSSLDLTLSSVNEGALLCHIRIVITLALKSFE